MQGTIANFYGGGSVVGDPNTLHLIDQGDAEYLILMPDGVSEEDIVEVYGGDRISLMTEDTAYVREDAFDTSER